MGDKKIYLILIPALLLATYGLFLFHETNLVTADLGRHIRNGEFLFSNPEILTSNFYSYTHPDYPVINHHWGTGFVFFLIWKLAGFAGVHFFFILFSLAALFIFFKIAKDKAGTSLAVLSTLLVIPLLNERTEIRPEVFSYFLSAVFFWLLLHRRWLWLLPILQIIWVNTHIYFFLGPVIVGMFLISDYVSLRVRLRWAKQSQSPGIAASASPPRNDGKRLLIILLLTIAATLVNPFGIKGALIPLTIFQDYGYRLVENQSVWFIEKLIQNPNFLIFKIAFGILIISFLLALLRNRKAIPIRNYIFAAGFSIAGWLAIRNFTIFGLFAIPIIAENLKIAMTPSSPPPHEGERKWGSWFALALTLLIFLLTLSGELQSIYPYNRNFGLGVSKENSASADFFKQNKLQGPIFNNYDIGGYLIYHLFPLPSSLSPGGTRLRNGQGGEGEGERVFVDNRPEAYSTEFFQEVYIGMQENEEKWQEQLEKYKFNAIFFSHRDYTPWGQKFLINRAQDQAWAPVFADNYAIIFVRRTPENEDFIKQYEIKYNRSSL